MNSFYSITGLISLKIIDSDLPNRYSYSTVILSESFSLGMQMARIIARSEFLRNPKHLEVKGELAKSKFSQSPFKTRLNLSFLSGVRTELWRYFWILVQVILWFPYKCLCGLDRIFELLLRLWRSLRWSEKPNGTELRLSSAVPDLISKPSLYCSKKKVDYFAALMPRKGFMGVTDEKRSFGSTWLYIGAGSWVSILLFGKKRWAGYNSEPC